MEWTLEDNPNDSDLSVLSQGVTEAGRAISNSQAMPIACIVRSGGSVVAGISGHTEFSRLFIKYLWVSGELQRRGFASKLLVALETGAAQRGCKDALVETLLDDVALMYQRRQFVPIAVIPNYVGLFSRYILLKPLPF